MADRIAYAIASSMPLATDKLAVEACVKDPVEILGVPISQRSMAESIEQVKQWLSEKTTCRTVTFSNSHMLALAGGDPKFLGMLQSMDMNCADGMPVFVVARTIKGATRVGHVPGPDFMPCFIRDTVGSGYKHFILGGGPGIAQAAVESLLEQCPGSLFAGTYAPPYKPISSEDVADQCAIIRESGADVVWVALGCPKQEHWLYLARPHLPGTVLLAVGQAVDILAGAVNRAPRLHRKLGLEWLYRLTKNPSRLGRRYLVYNSRFLYLLIKETLSA